MLGVDYELAKAIFKYDMHTGIITWKYRSINDPIISKNYTERSIKSFNTRCANKPAGTPHPDFGHLHIRHMVEGKDVTSTAHHIAWLLMTGSPPEQGYDIDHKDQNPANNAWSNLRLVHRSINISNTDKIRKDNRSGVRGVYFSKKSSVWITSFKIKDKVKEVYRGKDFFEAVCIRKSLEVFNDFGLKNSNSKFEKVAPIYSNNYEKIIKLKGVCTYPDGFRVIVYRKDLEGKLKQINLGVSKDWFEAVCILKSYEVGCR